MNIKGIWLAALLLISCTAFAKTTIKGNGNIVTKSIPVEDYERLSIGNRIEYGATFSIKSLIGKSKKDISECVYMQTMGESMLEITTDENLFDWLNISQKEGLLQIEGEDDMVVRPTKLLIRTASRNLKEVDICGCMDFIVNTLLSVDEIRFAVSGFGDLKIEDLTCRKLYCGVSGVGNAYFTGKADMGVYYLSGVGRVYAFGCAVKELKCDVSGVGQMQVMATNNLKASTSGIGSIKYKGDAIVSASTSGIGKIKKVN